MKTMWRLEDEPFFGEQVALTIYDGNGYAIAGVGNYDWQEPNEPVTDPRVLANAHLMVSAPLLRDALEAAESFISGFVDDEIQTGMPKLLLDIRTALASAKGVRV